MISSPRESGSDIAAPARTVTVPATGMGTRFLPTAKTVPEELLPVVDTPGIEIIAEEAITIDVQRLATVAAPSKNGALRHFDPCPDLEQTSAEYGKDRTVAKARCAIEVIRMESIVQDRPLGLGHAVLVAEPLFEDDEDSITVMLPNGLMFPVGVTDRVTEVRKRSGGSVLCALEIPHEEVYNYGVFDIGDTTPAKSGELGVDAVDADAWGDVKRVKGMVRKLDPADVPSNFVAIGRYLLDRAIFDTLHRISRGKGGEYQLVGVIELPIQERHPVHMVVHKGFRHDLGGSGGFIRVCVDFGLKHPNYGEGLHDYMQQRLAQNEQV